MTKRMVGLGPRVAATVLVLVAVWNATGGGHDLGGFPTAPGPVVGNDDQAEPLRTELIESAVKRLLEMQEEDGAWPYEGVYRVRRQIPVGYRVGGTAIVCAALLDAPLADRTAADQAISRGVDLILRELEHPLMQPSRENTYDVRVWGHIYALELFSRLRASQRFAELQESIDPWLPRLVATLVEQQLERGGWNYANRNRQAAFVTAPAMQALLWAQAVGQEVPEEVLRQAATAVAASRSENGAYSYSGSAPGRRATPIPGSIARMVVCEATLHLMGQGDAERLQSAVDAFYEHWEELEKRRQKSGTHEPPYGVAPYYFYYGHRYLAQAIPLLPADRRNAEYRRFEDLLLKTKEADDTWNDRVFARSAAFGTAMSILSLSRDRVSLPPPLVGVETGQ